MLEADKAGFRRYLSSAMKIPVHEACKACIYMFFMHVIPILLPEFNLCASRYLGK